MRLAESALPKISRKTLLYKSGVKYADYALNHVEGCSHACAYPCYAMMMKRRFSAVKSFDDWIRPKIVGNTLELLDKELPRLKTKMERVFLCFSTDPFMHEQPEIHELTLAILRRLHKENINAVVITKGVYPSELADTSRYGTGNEYGSTIVTLAEEFRQRFEPGAAPILARINSLRTLHEAGLKTWVSMEPYPTPNIIKQDIRDMMCAVSFVDKIVFGRWNYSRQSSAFAGAKVFYESMANHVIKFGKEFSVGVHIKEGTAG